MRISADSADGAFHPAVYGTRVWLDDAPCPGAVTADEELGEVVVYAKDESGLYIIRHGRLVRQTLRGKVRLELSAALRRQVDRNDGAL